MNSQSHSLSSEPRSSKIDRMVETKLVLSSLRSPKEDKCERSLTERHIRTILKTRIEKKKYISEIALAEIHA